MQKQMIRVDGAGNLLSLLLKTFCLFYLMLQMIKPGASGFVVIKMIFISEQINILIIYIEINHSTASIICNTPNASLLFLFLFPIINSLSRSICRELVQMLFVYLLPSQSALSYSTHNFSCCIGSPAQFGICTQFF